MKEYDIREVLFKDQVKSVKLVNLIGIVILCLVLSIDLVFFFIKPNHQLKIGTYRLIFCIIILIISFLLTKSKPNISALLTISGLYFFYIYFPLIPTSIKATENIFLLVFMFLVISSLPYLCYNFKETKKTIIFWQVIILVTGILSFKSLFDKLGAQSHSELQNVFTNNPMFFVAIIIAYCFIQFVIYKAKINNYELKFQTAEVNNKLHRRYQIIETQKRKLELQKTELNEYQEELKSINNQLEANVKERTLKLEQQNEIFKKYGFINSKLIRNPIIGLKQLIKNTAEVQPLELKINEHISGQILELDEVTGHISELLNSDSLEKLEQIEKDIVKKYSQ